VFAETAFTPLLIRIRQVLHIGEVVWVIRIMQDTQCLCIMALKKALETL
jgi:hypothetical protein